ncbi:MAG TPA: glycosyltransferase family 87 protein [Gemmataceae bacterium]|nr:glycosyltransferase family 87 protein [Gemmataceae bacterium]
MQATPPVAWLTKWEKCGLGVLLAATLAFGGLVELRSAFLSRRMGDLGCYLRAAWAVRAGEDLYAITDDNHWHYNYPPLLAILLVPLADPPAGTDAAGTVPYPVSVALWYGFNLLCLACAVHWLARALERTSADPAVRRLPAGCRRWWALRLIPVLACLTPIGHTLMRGQVNLLVLALLCAAAAALLRGRSGQAGLCLAVATCLKVIPAFLVIFPLWKRDRRCLTGFALGLVIGLGLVPAAVFGPARALVHYRTWSEVLLRPALVGGPDQSRARELLAAPATASQSLISTLHNTLHPDPDSRPWYPSPWLRAVAWLIGAVLTALTFLGAGRHARNGVGDVVVFGALILIMLLLSPVCHRHYFCLAVPLVMGLTAAYWERRAFPKVDIGLALVLTVNFVANSVSHLPGCEGLRDAGLGTYAALLLWLTALVKLRRRPAFLGPQPALAA